ncbi:MAG TPA: CHASE domain-containing protein [Gemmatimonadaceae bacterium]|nr:CHASE domain-containing protein [Gemmatimonadaceae bacterium]
MLSRVRRWNALPWFVLGISLAVTAVATWAALATVHGRIHARFTSAVQSTRDRIEGRLDTYVALLQATAGLFAASRDVRRDEFHAYAARLRVRERYPGIQGIGYSQHVTPAGIPALERRMHAQGEGSFHVWPESERGDYHAILYLEPLDRRNEAALGYDMFTDTTRREAMIRARDAGAPAMSGHVQLVQEIDQGKQAGFLIYVPVYRGGDVPATVEARRAELDGFVYAPFRADDLFQGIFGSEAEPRVSFRLYDGPQPSAAALLHDSDMDWRSRPDGELSSLTPLDARTDTIPMRTAGRQWTLVFTPTTGLLDSAGRGMVPLVAAAGAMVSLLLFLLARSHVRDREREWRATRETAALASQVQARNAELAAANRLKSEFLATMSHEIRTPLNAIIGYTEIIEMGLSGPVTPEQSAQLSRIASSGKHLLGLVDDILDLSRIEANRLSVSQVPARVETVMDAALGFLRPQATAQHIALVSSSGDPEDCYVGDEQRVQQILVNLLANAVKFTPAGGQVTLRSGRAAELPAGTDAPASGPWIWFTVEDTGVGITPELQQRIFQPFVQGDSGYTRTHGGAGLGLTISRRLARLMGGELTMESAQGEGSRFTLWLPAAGHDAMPTRERAELAERR